jgi:hypothetical protein
LRWKRSGGSCPGCWPGTREYVLIKGDQVVSLWPDEDEAYDAGCERFGVEPFLVKRVEASERPHILLIDLPNPCHP